MSCWKEPNIKHAFALSWMSVILTIIFAVTAIVYYMTTGSAMCLVFGLENIVDFMSSVVVLWRFWASGKMTKEREKILKRRELRASMAISLILMILGMGVISTSSYDIARGPGAGYDLDVILGMAVASVFIFGSLAMFKFQYANALASESLYKDGVCSLIGTILAAALFTNTLIIRRKPNVWWVDPCVAMVCGFAALFVGFHSIFVAWMHRRIPIFSLSWWKMSRGDGSAVYRQRNDNTNGKAEDERNLKPKAKKTKKTKTNNKKHEIEMKQAPTDLSSEIV